MIIIIGLTNDKSDGLLDTVFQICLVIGQRRDVPNQQHAFTNWYMRLGAQEQPLWLPIHWGWVLG